MTVSLFVGNAEGTRIAAAHTLVRSEQIRVAGLLNQLTARDFQMPDENGWLGVPIAPELDDEAVATWLSAAGEIAWKPDVTRLQIEETLGTSATQALFEIQQSETD